MNLTPAKKTVNDFFANDLFPEKEEPTALTEKGKHSLNASKKATVKNSAKKEPAKGKESRERRSQRTKSQDRKVEM
ncbi:hypothetical protein DPMN_120249 [Dreissena polymorpha]|uniref:Uncharacterized protein n=1 Tax=Dreissena polymorpha TaxID=45954 RepID=A0A9D4GKH3_DREPO|nr:hypothetical protein DPMN_120249 [Dreissena polymorpha]